MNTWPTFLILGLLALAALILTIVVGTHDYRHRHEGRTPTRTLIMALGVLIVVILWIVSWIRWDERRSQDRTRENCERFGVQVDRAVRFVDYRFHNWECLVETTDGWVPRQNFYVDERD